MQFKREDWQLFRTIETIGQRAGVPKSKLSAVVAKELADNALDACGSCEFGELDNNGFYIKDTGEGIDDIETMFSINRPLTSSKLLRLPQRGALGNGLRVVTGAVLATNGKLFVSTKRKKYQLIPQYNDGFTLSQYIGEYNELGTKVTVYLGEEAGRVNLGWVNNAKLFAKGKYYRGKTSAYWYTSEAFFELCLASVDMTVLGLISQFDGCTGQKAVLLSSDFKNRQANTLTQYEANLIMMNMRSFSKSVKANRLGNIGELTGYQYANTSVDKAIIIKSSKGKFNAEIPTVIEVWAKSDTETSIIANINKSPITSDLYSSHNKSTLEIYGCNLWIPEINIGRSPMFIVLNVITPYMPITTDGKEPDFSQLNNVIRDTIQKAVNRVKRVNKTNNVTGKNSNSQKAVVLNNLQTAINKASGGGQYRFSHRQLYYAVRPFVIEELGKELTYNNFGGIITEYENNHGKIPGMYFDERGVIYHPHLHQEMPLGTITVEQYSRPEWTFNKVLYCEKEGLFPALINNKWPEKYDCVLLTSKGYASRAAKDLIDLLGDTEEKLTFYCVHDADAAGTMIYETLLKETGARGKRKVKIINLGLNPWEAKKMRLQEEKVKPSKTPIAKYIKDYDKGNGTNWADWLKSHRYELNAMTTPQFINWLDHKMEKYNSTKVIPPDEILISKLHDKIRDNLKEHLTEKILKDANLEGQINSNYNDLLPLIHKQENIINETVKSKLEEEPVNLWEEPVIDIATEITMKNEV